MFEAFRRHKPETRHEEKEARVVRSFEQKPTLERLSSTETSYRTIHNRRRPTVSLLGGEPPLFKSEGHRRAIYGLISLTNPIVWIVGGVTILSISALTGIELIKIAVVGAGIFLAWTVLKVLLELVMNSNDRGKPGS